MGMQHHVRLGPTGHATVHVMRPSSTVLVAYVCLPSFVQTSLAPLGMKTDQEHMWKNSSPILISIFFLQKRDRIQKG